MKEVEAIKEKSDRQAIHRQLEKKSKGTDLYSDVWAVGMRVGLRISDLLSLKYSDLETGVLTIIEAKTKNTKKKPEPRVIKLEQAVLDIIAKRKAMHPLDVYLFQVHSNRSTGKPVGRISVAKKFKEVGDVLGLTLGTHSMRKSMGYYLHTVEGKPIELIRKMFNHSSNSITLKYIGIEKQDIEDAYECLGDMM